MPGNIQHTSRYYGRKSKKGGYDWVVCISDEGCFITDPIENWEKDNDYFDEAQSNPLLYDTLETEQAEQILAVWGRSLLIEASS
jgi:hypothetical protein